MRKPKKPNILETAKKHYKEAEDAWSKNRTRYLEDVKFAAGQQWPTKIKEDREKAGRPTLVVDKSQQYVRQVVNDGRMNRPSIKVRPVDDKGDVKVADVFQGIIRHILDRSNADEAFDTALECAVKGGYGYFRVLTEYAHEGTFNQDICIKRIRNPLGVLLSPGYQNADASDARWGFVVDDIPKESFKQKYPNAKETGWETDFAKYGDGWLGENTVRVAEYWYKVEEKRTLLLLADGTTVSAEDYALSDQMIPVLDQREIPVDRVKWLRMTGAEVLEERDWPGKYIPIVPVFGNESDIEGEVIYTGLIHSAKDALRLYNYSRSAYAERVALSPKAPYVAAAGQVEQYEEWETANTENHSVLRYDPQDVNGTPLPPPQRQPASDIPEGFARDMQLSEHDIQAAMGMYSASLGQQSNEKSGKAILARQREGDVATFHFQDNLNRAIRYLGRILVDLIPKIYDSQRIIRILGEDGSQDVAMIDPNQAEPVLKMNGKEVYNLGAGEFDVTVAAGPSYTTKRQEAAEAMMQMGQANPQFLQVAGDLMVRNMDWPGAEEIADRLKLLLPPQILDAERKKEESPEIGAIVAQAEQAIQQREQVIEQAKGMIADLQKQLQDKEAELAIKAKGEETKAYSAETQRMQALQPAMTPQDIKMIVLQTMQELMMPAKPPEVSNGFVPDY